MYRIHEPSHHGDVALVLVAQQGFRAHHEHFGNIPAVKGVTGEDAVKITAHIRALPRANGIDRVGKQ